MAEKFTNSFFRKPPNFLSPPCSIHLGRYNMIFVETSAKDNTGVEQVSFDSTAESDPNSPFLCDQHIHLDCRLSWSWWTECYKAQASGALAKVSPTLLLLKLGRQSWGMSKYLNAHFGVYEQISERPQHQNGFYFQASTKKNLQSPALLWNLNRCIYWLCLYIFLHFSK